MVEPLFSQEYFFKKPELSKIISISSLKGFVQQFSPSTIGLTVNHWVQRVLYTLFCFVARSPFHLLRFMNLWAPIKVTLLKEYIC